MNLSDIGHSKAMTPAPEPAQTTTPQSPRDLRTYFVSDERLRAFAQLTPLQRLQWVEQCSHFVRLGQQARQAEQALAANP
jgi:hypothetical protein